ncbi:MAG TPA: NADH-quinone oxidoreductase subunit J [Desulfobulbus sp.]|nr:NADH-quinone oxidoreductase subunit J [Desulfobulbus sp.]
MSFERFALDIYALTFASLLVQIVVGAVMAVMLKKLVHCFLGLVITMVGVAGLYYFLGSPLLAVMQIMIYVGAVCVAIAFGLSLTHKAGEEGLQAPGPRGIVPPFITLAMLGSVLLGLSRREWVGYPQKIDESPIGMMLLGEYLLPFEVISILLTVAVIGAISVALIKRRR